MAGGKEEPLLATAEEPPSGEDSPKRPRSISDLPDLTARIIEAGLWQEYQRFRQGYLNWRQGKHQGARGEVTESGLVAERERLEFLEPTEAEWHWRKTISYWIVVLTLEGSFIFLFTSLFGCYPDVWGGLLEAVTMQTSYVGGTCFLVATYLLNFEVINLKVGDGPPRWNPWSFRTHLAHCHEIGLHPWPYLATVVYFTGAVLFAEQQTLAFFKELVSLPGVKFWGVQVPCMLGGFLFLLASAFEVVEWCTGRGQTILVAVAHNVFGSFTFAVGGVLFMLDSTLPWDPEWWGNLAYALGGYGFMMGSTVSLVLWRDGNFGLTYSSQLATLAPQHVADRFSTFGILVVVGLCFLASVAATVFFCEAKLNLSNAMDEADYATRTFYPFLIFALVHMVIALRSAVVKLPPEQPWRALHEACHAMLLLASLVLLAQFADCVYQVRGRH